MKKFLFISLIALCFSCNSDDDGGTFEDFNLTIYTPNPFFEEDTTQNFDSGDIVWSFNFASQQVTVQVASGVDPVRLNPGTYSFSLNDNICNYDDNRYFHVDGDVIGLLIMDDYSEGKITISNACVDGAIFVFERD